jgi:hypothetical protein
MAEDYTNRADRARISPNTDFGDNRMLGPDVNAHTIAALQLDGPGTGKRPDGIAPIDWGLAPVNPPVKVIPPEFAVHLKDLRADIPCVNEEQLETIQALVSQGAAAGMSTPWIRAICKKPDGLNPQISVGLWPFNSANDTVVEGRMKGLRSVDLLFEDQGDLFGIMITKSLVIRTMSGAWNNMPKRLNHAGLADPSGPVHLTGLEIRFEEPDTVKLIIRGHDTSAFPDVSFKVTYTDTFSINNSSMVLVESDSEFVADTDWHVVLGVLFLLIPLPLGNFIAAAFLGQAYYASTLDAPDIGTSLGATLAAGFLRDHILLPPDDAFETGLRLNLSYTRMNVVNAGIFTGGTYLPTPREPALAITGPLQIAADSNAASVSKPFSFQTTDLRNANSVQWSGDASFSNASANRVVVTFDLTGVPDNVVVMRDVSVQVTDSDGVSATGTVSVEIHRSNFGEPRIPPICRVKPWLPQCR